MRPKQKAAPPEAARFALRQITHATHYPFQRPGLTSALLTRHFTINPDPLVELERRQQLWSSAPPSNGVLLHSSIVPGETIAAAIAEIKSFRSKKE